MGRLTTHVLDTARGRPGAGIAVRVLGIDGDRRRPLAETVTDADGRCAAPLLEGADFAAGVYELEFGVGDYQRSLAEDSGDAAEAIPFLDRVTLRFGVADADEHYHVPLLLSPYGYTTYRGS